MAAHSIIYVERQLRLGKTPEDLGAVVIGEGAQKKAYRIDGFVIKENSGGWIDQNKRPPKTIANYGARPCRQYKVKQWCIQEYVTPLRDYVTGSWNIDKKSDIYQKWQTLYCARLGDMHEYNCGVNAHGQLVVFDW